jgi:hypothetical protein
MADRPQQQHKETKTHGCDMTGRPKGTEGPKNGPQITRCPESIPVSLDLRGLPREEDDFDRRSLAFGDFGTVVGVTAFAAMVGAPCGTNTQ